LTFSLPAAFGGELPDALVGKTLSITGVNHETVTRTQYGMTYSDVIYKDSAGEEVLMLRLATSEQYPVWKQAMGSGQVIAGVGIEAFEIKSIRMICAKAAVRAACVIPFIPRIKTVTNEQLIGLLKQGL
jgi:hypothetical protein